MDPNGCFNEIGPYESRGNELREEERRDREAEMTEAVFFFFFFFLTTVRDNGFWLR
jgi:hypothetical protein